MIEQVRRLMVGLALAGLTSCSGNKPPVVTPTPPPPQPQCAEGQATCCWHRPPGNEWLYACKAPIPGGVLNVAGGPAQCPNNSCGGGTTPPPSGTIQFANLELRLTGLQLMRGGQTFQAFGAIQCCMGFKLGGVEQNSRWPLASESWMDYTKANMFHFRMGPFYADADHESEWADTGGPFIGDSQTPPTPDLAFNDVFWNKARDLAIYAGNKGANVEVNVIDTWYCKHAASNWGDQRIPWPQADIDACGKTMTPVQERYIRKNVSVFGCLANVTWLTDNEGGEINGTQCSWYKSVYDLLRDEEPKSGCGVAHLIGTNNTDCASGPFDFVATHAREALTQPIGGKHTENNERNPQFSVEQEHSNFVTARNASLNYWYWRAEQTDEQMEQTLALFRGESPTTPVGCFAPEPEDPKWAEPPASGPVGDNMLPSVRAAQAVIGDRCGKIGPCPGGPGEPEGHHCQQNETLALLAAELRKQGLCASGPWPDAVVVKNPQGLWQEFHAVAFNTGCYSNDSAQLPKKTWTYTGTNPTPLPPAVGQCVNPEPIPLSKFNVKEHTKGPNWTVVDSTPLVGPDAAYCASIGFTDGRSNCSVRQEGDPLRPTCEAEIVGGNPQWTGPGELVPENPYMYRVRRGVGGTVTVCGKGNVCGSVEVTP